MSRPLRRSQAIAPFGIGALVDFPGPVSLIHAGLDAWPFDEANPDHLEFRVDDEPRLARRLGVDFFVQPPDFRFAEHSGATDSVNLNLRLPFLRFPIWHSCPRCGKMFESRYHIRSAPMCEGPIGSGGEKGKLHKPRRTVQVRFVAACTAGHLRDFPWIEWLGLDPVEWDGTRKDRWLRMLSTGSASISGVVVVAERMFGSEIKEEARKSLAGAFSVESSGATAFTRMGLMCDGQNPALGIGDGGTDPAESCGENLRAVLRGASNLYFGDVRSSIYVPEIQDAEYSQEVLDLLDDHRFKEALLTSALDSDDGLLSIRSAGIITKRLRSESAVDATQLAAAANKHALRDILVNDRLIGIYIVQKAKISESGVVNKEILDEVIRMKFPDWRIDANHLVESVNDWLRQRGGQHDGNIQEMVPDSPSDSTYRSEEYRAFCRDGQDGFPKANLLVRSRRIEEYSDLIQNNFSRISLLDKLRETRAFVGFSRVFANGSLTADQRWKLISRQRKNWLPAVVVRGEGIFLVFDAKKLDEWDRRCGDIHRERLISINKNLQSQAARRHSHADIATPKFVLLHTFAHVLISQLIFDCGYGSSSLRERIYCSDTHPQMTGILIYTAAGDSEGTMGGLVKMGEPGVLERTIARAIDRARWCSSDPVCIESPGQGPDNCNLAACHSCALLPETSCEQQNRLLDRGTLTGVLDNPGIGFFTM
jgi:hypothetical protein